MRKPIILLLSGRLMILGVASGPGSGGPDDTPSDRLMLQPITQIAVFRVVRVRADGGQDHHQVLCRDAWAKVGLLLLVAHGKDPTLEKCTRFTKLRSVRLET
ncbi:hypothetical protein [Paracoccus tibetensis]|uniref:hypothetical protein n=1 Tax=Paracoccus tibetensis TaxID=336292 RepID=UPI001C31298B|nr:hypothetical protein [Paracoccus tibetensis]